MTGFEALNYLHYKLNDTIFCEDVFIDENEKTAFDTIAKDLSACETTIQRLESTITEMTERIDAAMYNGVDTTYLENIKQFATEVLQSLQ